MPSLFIITGSNGAGKSTVGFTYLPPDIQKTYIPFDGDKLALNKRRELRSSIKSDKEAKRMADDWLQTHFKKRVNNALRLNDHFVYEGHFRDDESWVIPKRFKKKKYFLSLIFMGLKDPHQSELRVIDRAKYGGHNVPIYEIEANFYGNLDKLNKYYRIFDEMHIIDTSESLNHKVLLHIMERKIMTYMPTKHLPSWFVRHLPNLHKIIKIEEKQKKSDKQ